MKDKKINGLLPGWPPFTEFKKNMIELLDEAQKPLKSDIQTIKNSLISHINKTEANFKTLTGYLTNYVTDTDKNINTLNTKVDSLKNDTNKNIGTLNTKFDSLNQKTKKTDSLIKYMLLTP